MAAFNLERVSSLPSGRWVSDAIVIASSNWEETLELMPERIAANFAKA